MGQQVLSSKCKKKAHFRVCKVSSHVTEILEIHADEPRFHVLFIPGNPGVVTFYQDFLESLYELLRGRGSVTAIGHISHTIKNWESGKLFSLQDQIAQKVDFIKQELQGSKVPIILIGHSIGAHISFETFKRHPEKVVYYIGLYPTLAPNLQSKTQSTIKKITKSSVICVSLSSVAGLLGVLPIGGLKFIVRQTLGKAWSNTAVEACCSHMPKYHTLRNLLFMEMTVFENLSETPDWAFMRENQHRIAFLFGLDDHWGPLQMFEEISIQAPQTGLAIEREGHSHAFCCTEAGSSYVANHVASLITDLTSRSSWPSKNS